MANDETVRAGSAFDMCSTFGCVPKGNNLLNQKTNWYYPDTVTNLDTWSKGKCKSEVIDVAANPAQAGSPARFWSNCYAKSTTY